MKQIASTDFQIIPEQELALRFAPDSKLPTAQLFGLPLVKAERGQMARRIVSKARRGRETVVNFINAHCINTARADRAYRDALKDSDMLLPDGVGMEIAARMAGRALGDNLNGTDLYPEICAEAACEGVGLFLLGGAPGVAADAAGWAKSRHKALRICGTQHGYYDQADEDAVIAMINASQAGILFVGFGVPLQEKWIERNRHRIDVPVILGVGGLFDYYSGRIPRAPILVRACKSEWMWRLAMEPRRLAQRYLLGNAAFLLHAAAAAAEIRGWNDRAYDATKRALDVTVAMLALIVLLPLLLLTALAIWTEDRGPIFFFQTRIGADGVPFRMVKFRSMFTDAEARKTALLATSDRQGASFKMRRDPRITRVGRIIRRLSIDELPQLFNVLGGSMAIVGPRPALASEVGTYRHAQWERLGGKPGITCSWQVSGRADIPFHRQAIMDRAYLRRRNILMDMRLMVQTIPAVIGGRGAY